VPDIAARAASYAMPGVVVDGQDVLACYRAVRQAVERARGGHGPSLVEAKTYRFHEHAYGLKVPQPYLDEQVVAGWRAGHDPIPLFTARLDSWGLVGADAVADMEAAVAAEVAEAVDFARRSPFPEPADAYADLYAPAGAAADGDQ
jgi:pyruvate dehydrogenase E1 component alpha subunit